ncbi:hypothetical protein V1278_001826 [Bradyrhizobium sp. AZCC 1577]
MNLGGRAVLFSSWVYVAFWIVAIVSSVAFAIWLVSWVINVDTKITAEPRSSKPRTSVYRGRIVSCFWLRLRASSARIREEDSAMSMQLGRLV